MCVCVQRSRQLDDATLLKDLKLKKRTNMMLVGAKQSEVDDLHKLEQVGVCNCNVLLPVIADGCLC